MVGTGPFVKYVSSDGGRDGPAKIILAYKGGRDSAVSVRAP